MFLKPVQQWQQMPHLHVPLGEEAAICCQFVGLRQFHNSLLQWPDLRVHCIDHLKQAVSLWDCTTRAVTKIKFIKKSELFPETKGAKRKLIKCPKWATQMQLLELFATAFYRFNVRKKQLYYQGTKWGVHSKLHGFFKANILEDTLNFKKMSFKICINQWISFKAAQQHYRTSNKIILLEISLRKLLFKQLWFPAQHYIPPSVQPGLCISHVLLLHVVWAYFQVLPYLQDPSSSDFPTPKWRHFFCLNYICFTGQRASRKKIIKMDFFFKAIGLILSKIKSVMQLHVIHGRANSKKSTLSVISEDWI